MGDLLEDIFDKDIDAFSRGLATAIFVFCALVCWELFCAGVALVASIGPLTFGKALLYVNIYGLAMLVAAILVGVAVTIAAIKKEKEDDPSEQ